MTTRQTLNDCRGAHRRAPLLAAGLTMLMLLPLTSGAAQASSWSWGSNFRLGPLHFRIGHSPHHHRGSYFRVDVPMRSRSRCSDYCFVDRGVYYHHESCPVVRGYIRDHGYSYSDVIAHYGPYRATTRYDRRYDRDRYQAPSRRDHWRDERYRRHDERSRQRYRHRHDKSCPDWHRRRY